MQHDIIRTKPPRRSTRRGMQPFQDMPACYNFTRGADVQGGKRTFAALRTYDRDAQKADLSEPCPRTVSNGSFVGLCRSVSIEALTITLACWQNK